MQTDEITTAGGGDTVVKALATRLEQLNDEIVTFVETCTAQQWTATTEEGWPVPVAGMHIALSHLVIPHWVQRIAAGLPVTETLDDFATLNAADALRYAGAGRSEVAERLRINGAAAVAFLGGLTADEMAGAGWFAPAGAELTAAAVTEHVLVGHPAGHFATLRAAI